MTGFQSALCTQQCQYLSCRLIFHASAGKSQNINMKAALSSLLHVDNYDLDICIFQRKVRHFVKTETRNLMLT